MTRLIKYKKTHKNAVDPVRGNATDAGYDLTATSKETKNGFIQYGTGIHFEIPEGMVGLIYPRSSITKKGLMLKNSVGIIDAGYRGEVMFRFHELDNRNIYEVGDRVGQIIFQELPKILMKEVDELSDSERGEGGFGSTGQ